MLTLDIGCGTHSRGDVNIDPYPFATRHRAEPNINPKTKHFIIAACEHLPFRDRIFTGATMYDVIEHLDSPLVGLREVARVVKGWLYLKTPSEYNMGRIATHIYTWNRHTLKMLLLRIFPYVKVEYRRGVLPNGGRLSGKLTPIINGLLARIGIYRDLTAICYLNPLADPEILEFLKKRIGY